MSDAGNREKERKLPIAAQQLAKQGTNSNENQVTDCEYNRHFDQQHRQRD
jgi:hypothetical protein